MKKSYIALAVFSMAALLVSCQTEEIRVSTFEPGENDVLFSMAYNRADTKSSDDGVPYAKSTSIDLGFHEGTHLFLEESVIDLDGISVEPVTKGTPAFTENLGVLYEGKLGVYVDASSGGFGSSEINYTQVADTMLTGKGWQYYHKYDSDPWPSNGSVGFYLRMPMDDSNVTINSRTGGKISFSYTSPSDVSVQQDILFGYRSVDKATYNTYLPDGLPVLLNHALTGVKFAAGNPEDVTITGITISDIYNSGTCDITPASETDYKDVVATHSSAGAAEWTLGETKASFSVEYSNTLVEFKPSTEEGGGSFGSKGKYPDNFATHGGKNNLNDTDASQTFWFIPQSFADTTSRNVVLTVSYTVPGSTETLTLNIDFGRELGRRNVEWKAGQLYTYTIRIDEVNVKIEDTVIPGGQISDTDPHGIVSSIKKDVKITNTGNTDAFIRAAIVGQWVIDQDGERVIMFGFTDEINHLYEVESWYEDQFVDHSGQHGVFEELHGYKNIAYGKDYTNVDNVNNWVYDPDDRYFYYTKPVAPGMATGQTVENGPYDRLFKSYTIKMIPHTSNYGVALSKQMYFTLEVATQAINARTSNGTLMTDYKKAWADALKIDDTQVGETQGNN